MKTVRLKDNIVIEIIPEYALPVEQWYGADFAAHCIEAPDDAEQGMIYNGETFTALEPEETTPPPSNEELAEENKMLKAQVQALTDRNEFMDDCIAEMATQVYA